MKEYTRIQWTDYNARDIWEPRFSQINRRSKKVEVKAVLEGIRKVAMANLVQSEFNSLDLPRPLTVKVLAVSAAPKVFSNRAQDWRPGQPFVLRTVIGRKGDVNRFMRAYVSEDDIRMGQLLNYPACCIESFNKYWKEERDLTWRQADVKSDMTRVVIDPYHLLNPFYGRFGVRPIWHIPCSFRCAESKMLASDYLKLWDGEEKEWLDEILSWPLEWSSLHGAAETRTPVCKIISESKPESVEHVIQYVGRGYPDQMLRGNRFPYNREEDNYSNNGFHSPESMKHYHEIVHAAAQQAWDVQSISDPGCGNGYLLEKLCRWHTKASGHGTDFNHHAIAQGRRLHPDVSFTEGNLFDRYSSGDMVVFMPGRLLENPDRAERFVQELNFRYLLLYGYSAYASKVMDLKKQYWPDCKEVATIIDDDAVATLLEKS